MDEDEKEVGEVEVEVEVDPDECLVPDGCVQLCHHLPGVGEGARGLQQGDAKLLHLARVTRCQGDQVTR